MAFRVPSETPYASTGSVEYPVCQVLSCLLLLGSSSQEVLSLEGGVGGGMDTYTDYSSIV